MKKLFLSLLCIFLATSMWADETHSDGYSICISDAEEKNGTLVEIKIGHATRKPHGKEITRIKEKEGFTRFMLYPAQAAEGKRINEYEAQVMFAYVADSKFRRFEEKYSHPQESTDPNDPFSGENMVFTKLNGITSEGILWKIGNTWTIVIK
jgi:hypothetical protein